jgi:hypothetical protein
LACGSGAGEGKNKPAADSIGQPESGLSRIKLETEIDKDYGNET